MLGAAWLWIWDRENWWRRDNFGADVSDSSEGVVEFLVTLDFVGHSLMTKKKLS
jgi:hypothetical protein